MDFKYRKGTNDGYYLLALVLAIVMIGFFIPNTMCSVTISSDDGSGNTTAPDNDPGFANVVDRGGLSAVYIGEGWVLSADHVGAGSILHDGVVYPHNPLLTQSFRQVPILWPPKTHDLVVFGLYPPFPDLPDLTIATESPPIDTPVMMVGYGRNRGPATIEQGVPGFEMGEGKSRRWGMNRISEFTESINGYKFNSRFDEDGVYHEAIGANGDSGGAVFAAMDGQTVHDLNVNELQRLAHPNITLTCTGDTYCEDGENGFDQRFAGTVTIPQGLEDGKRYILVFVGWFNEYFPSTCSLDDTEKVDAEILSSNMVGGTLTMIRSPNGPQTSLCDSYGEELQGIAIPGNAGDTVSFEFTLRVEPTTPGIVRLMAPLAGFAFTPTDEWHLAGIMISVVWPDTIPTPEEPFASLYGMSTVSVDLSQLNDALMKWMWFSPDEHGAPISYTEPVLPEETITGSCQDESGLINYCGDQSLYECWCDPSCSDYGDCCPDYQEVCTSSPIPAPEPRAIVLLVAGIVGMSAIYMATNRS